MPSRRFSYPCTSTSLPVPGCLNIGVPFFLQFLMLLLGYCSIRRATSRMPRPAAMVRDLAPVRSGGISKPSQTMRWP